MNIRGRIQVGVGEARPRKKKPSVSVHVAGPRGPAGARQSPSRVLIVGIVSQTILISNIRIDHIEILHENKQFATQVWAFTLITVDPPDVL